MEEIVNNIFGLNDYKSMYFGLSLFDNNACLIQKSQLDSLYDGLELISDGYFPEIFAGTMWITEEPHDIKIRKSIKTNKRCYEVSRPLLFTHTSEFFIDKEAFPFILSHMRWAGNDKIYKGNCVKNSQWYDYGVLKKNWLYSPISVRYYTRMTGNSTTPDYLYLMGGSEVMFQDTNTMKYEVAYYSIIKYLTLAKTMLEFKHVYERVGSIENKLDINYVIDELKEKIHGF